jgi:hypothetical protein
MAVHLPAIPVVALAKYLLVGAGATIGSVYVVNLNLTVVTERARELSPKEKVLVRRERKREDGRDYIRIAIEASGKQAAWLAEKIDETLEKLLPKEGAAAEI